MKRLDIIYEDNHLIMVNKPSGVLVQGDSTGDEPLVEMVKKYIKDKYKKPGAVFLAPVHRIDRPVSGLVVFARTSKAAERMAKIFQDRKVKKTYWALVSNRPPEDEAKLINWLKKDPEKNRTHCYDSDRRGGKRAELDYKFLGKVGSHYLLEINPLTGRSHQIRAQLAKIGCTIKGDAKYGEKVRNKDGSINLHSRGIEFEHPVKKELLKVKAKLPKNDIIWQNFAHLG
ncbi:RluA family pseudouridine synthase [Limibacter armeniacum]|uniref:RluA family pseudouridine synthase n=1 Tax=Limibacter armeniacum TaxID=466084 RepID=UPI002FE61B09